MSKPKFGTHVQIQDGDGKIVAEVRSISDKDADRLVLCWNAFNEMPTSIIETMPGTVAEMVKTMTELYGVIDTYGNLLDMVDALLRVSVPNYADHPASSAIAHAREFAGRFKRPKVH